MKKIFFALVALMMSICAHAFDFDGIDLNGNVVEITRQISAKGYVYDEANDCLKGICQGTEIYLTINYQDVKQKNKIGQLMVDIPMKSDDALSDVAMTFNVIYHQVANSNGIYTYQIGDDGTTLALSKTNNGIRLTYSTPYYKKIK
ncbi:MAG: hypothetical protein NC344_11075 [Bacteroidales bacterium]|nr:hypothetical protein [Bacteroidales bacterium]MCM1148348.1 hypothetical protein [Bacteroidales bacterium]MCM1206959.1 hypothetical protein [Bacillota bacterium]MCM1511255.1 hypothetical protein [Clostridium sp.]